MNEHTLKNLWLQIREKIRENWSELTDEDLEEINGNETKLLEKLQSIYGYTAKKVQAEWQKFYDDFLENVDEAEEKASSTFHSMGNQINNFVQKSPMKALGIAAIAGIVLGLSFRIGL